MPTNYLPATPPADRTQLSLKPMADTLLAYRRTLWRGALAAVALITVVLAVVWIQAPTDLFGTVGFRVNFDGADQGKYPNGMPFSSAELVSSAVLDRVYQTNDLQRYLTFTKLKDSMFALE